MCPDTGPADSREVRDYFYLQHLQSVRTDTAQYYNQRFIGRGGNGTAFLVTCSSGRFAGVQMALKVFHKLSDSTRRRAFLEEIRLLRGFDHPAIIRVYDEGEYSAHGQTYPFVLVEYLPLTVRHLLVAHEIDRLRAIRIAMNCLSALCCMHNASPPLVHRDIKPENILISQSGAKLADFGLAMAIDQDDVDETQEADAAEETASPLGGLSAAPAPGQIGSQADQGVKPPPDERESSDFGGETELPPSQWPGMPLRYRTPELVAHARDRSVQVTTASDVFQLGCVLYELLRGFNPQEQVEKATDNIELDIREIGGGQGVALYELVRAMLSREAGSRPTAEDALERLNRIHRAFCERMASVTGQPV
jgi:serine/threonine-protein kinase